MTTDTTPDETLIRDAVATVADTERRYNEACSKASAADAALKAAQADYSAIIARAGAGEDVDPTEARAGLARATEAYEFAGGVVLHLEEKLAAARAATLSARAEAYRRVFETGRALRLDAAERLDAACDAFRTAHEDLDRASRVLGLARANGFGVGTQLMPSPHLNDLLHRLPQSGSVSAAERDFWKEARV